MNSVLIIGATSGIAHACARIWAAQGATLYLVARDAEKLQANAADLRVRGAAAVHTALQDLSDVSRAQAMVDAAADTLGGLDLVLLAHGTLPDNDACAADAALAAREFHLNATTTVALLTAVAARCDAQGRGRIGVITSVAGDRGRPSNYLYGSAKAAVQTFCEGLRARLFRHGVTLIDIRPGFIATRMTASLQLPQALVAQPADVAPRIVAAIERGKDVVYVPAFWALVMLLIRNIPRALFKRMKL
jgi:short-subunit dehydrogenase